MADWRQYYEKNSRKILAVLKSVRIFGPAQFAQSAPELKASISTPCEDSRPKIRYRSRVPLSHPAVRGVDISEVE